MKICLSCEGVTNTPAQRCGHCGASLLPTDSVHYPVRRGEADTGNPLIGTVVDGKYRLLSVLGRGGLGTVFRAQHIGSLMTVALKVLNPRFATRPEYRRALVPEARRAATVTHERCSRLLDVGDNDEGVAYLAMELVEGSTLDSIVHAGRLPPSLAVDVLLQVTEALEAIHAAGLVHCDLSPRNVMVQARSGVLHVKVLDFGIARSMRMAEEGRARSDFSGFVNPAFSAPELLAGEDVDARADLYSLGTLGWFLLTATLPIDDSDPRRAAAAVAAGELRPWPVVSGVPRRFSRLLQRCLSRDPALRPTSALAVRRELLAIRRAGRPFVLRGAMAAAALAAVLELASPADSQPTFLRPISSSALELAANTLPATAPPQQLRSARLGRLAFHFGGFAASRLRADLVRNGSPLTSIALHPAVDGNTGTLELSTEQPEWSDVVQALRSGSRDGAVDLTFLVPGLAPLGTARVRLDDEAPEIVARVHGRGASASDGDNSLLTGAATLTYSLQDASGSCTGKIEVALASGRKFDLDLPGTDGTFALGRELARVAADVASLGGGELVLCAVDAAGNERRLPPMAFARADVAAPSLLEVRGPAGEDFAPSIGGVLRLRVRLADDEADCRLLLSAVGGGASASAALTSGKGWQTVEVPLASPGVAAVRCVVVDAVGNLSSQEVVMPVRDRNLQLDFVGEGGSLRWSAGELVIGETGASALVSLGDAFSLVAANIELSSAEAPGFPGGVQTEAVVDKTLRFTFGRLPAGMHTLRLLLSEGGGSHNQRTYTVPLRVLPASIELRLPAVRSRYLPGLLQAGVLATHGAGLVEGNGWRIDPALRPYVRGTLWLGNDLSVPVPLANPQDGSAPLLPEVKPVSGHNLFAVSLRDVLDRPLRVLVGDEPCSRRFGDRTLDVVAEFWWSEAPPEMIGEELLVEYGQPARFKLRLPVPFTDADRSELRLGIGSGEVAATRVEPDGPDHSIALFELDERIWSVAAHLVGRTRQEFASQLESMADAYLATPAAADGRYSLKLRVRTVRTTLQPMQLGELGDVSEPLRDIRLLPVLAPSGPFEEPVPPVAPPRSLFRPQVAVAVRNMPDFLLQDTEFTWGQARALVAMLEAAPKLGDAKRFVHQDDPLGVDRLLPTNLLPPAPRSGGENAGGENAGGGAAAVVDEQSLTGVNFFQAYSMCRLLGQLLAGDVSLFRLPLGCELELAAYNNAVQPACNGATAHGGEVSVARFLDAEGGVTAARSRAMGDVVETTFGAEFVGLDFGVREWVFDLPHIDGGEMLLREWISDQPKHLERAQGIATGDPEALTDPIGPVRQLGVVRGLGLGERDGLIDADGQRLDVVGMASLPAAVPGVLRTLQLPRSGRNPLVDGKDPRLEHIGFRVVGDASALTRLRGRR